MEFGARLKEIRTSLNISQKELSEQTGLPSEQFKESRITR
jgi:transcriptional regulator with XRE-family HTH domain